MPRQRSQRMQRARKAFSSCTPGGRIYSSPEANRAIHPAAINEATPHAAVMKSLRVCNTNRLLRNESVNGVYDLAGLAMQQNF